MPDQHSTPGFNLDAEITRWCDRLAGAASDKGVGPDAVEMADHLHCQVDELIGAGLDPATAFVRATESLGEPGLLQAELVKASGPQYTSAQLMGFMVVYLATTVFAVSFIVVVFGGQSYAELMLAGVYLFWIPFLYFTARGRAAIRAECRMFKQLYRKLKT